MREGVVVARQVSERHQARLLHGDLLLVCSHRTQDGWRAVGVQNGTLAHAIAPGLHRHHRAARRKRRQLLRLRAHCRHKRAGALSLAQSLEAHREQVVRVA
eukprot:scaffold20134_cov66-Phaeocystis_antarctica.AAC.3